MQPPLANIAEEWKKSEERRALRPSSANLQRIPIKVYISKSVHSRYKFRNKSTVSTFLNETPILQVCQCAAAGSPAGSILHSCRNSGAMRDSGDRIRRERTSPTSSRTVLRRVLVLSEGRQFREAAAVLQKLNCNSVATVAADLPLDFLAEGLPHSAQLLETLFTKWVIKNVQKFFRATLAKSARNS